MCHPLQERLQRPQARQSRQVPCQPRLLRCWEVSPDAHALPSSCRLCGPEIVQGKLVGEPEDTCAMLGASSAALSLLLELAMMVVSIPLAPQGYWLPCGQSRVITNCTPWSLSAALIACCLEVVILMIDNLTVEAAA